MYYFLDINTGRMGLCRNTKEDFTAFVLASYMKTSVYDIQVDVYKI